MTTHDASATHDPVGSSAATTDPPVLLGHDGRRVHPFPGHRAALLGSRGGQYGRVIPTDGAVASESAVQVAAVQDRLRLARRLLAAFGRDVFAADVLNVGAGRGVEALCLAAAGARSVIATDHGGLFIGGPHERRRLLGPAADVVVGAGSATGAGASPGADAPGTSRGDELLARIDFRTDDLCRSSLPDQVVDLVLSWQTLEHLPDLAAAMATMRRVLRPGGLAFHEYHAFAGLDGAHALGTTDVPWGHLRLRPDAYEAHLRALHGDAGHRAIDFVRHGLNRASLADVRAAAEDAGLEVLALIPRTRTEDMLHLDAEVVAQVGLARPDLTVTDLVSRMVRVVLRAP